jgi:predicted DNA-binding transcriptional regulator AlpA
MTDDESLWKNKDLAAFLGYSETSVARMVTKTPDRLPPRVAGLGHPRWAPSVVRQWVIDRSVSGAFPAKRGRPRTTPEID